VCAFRGRGPALLSSPALRPTPAASPTRLRGARAEGDQRNLLQIGIVALLIGFAFGRSNLLNGGARRRDGAEVSTIDLVERWCVREVV